MDEKKDAVVIRSEDTLATKRNGQRQQLWSSTFLSNWFFLWMLPILTKSRQKTTKFTNLSFIFDSKSSAKPNVDQLEEAWNEQNERYHQFKISEKSIYIALKKVFAKEFFYIAFYKISWSFFTWAAAWYLLSKMLKFLAEKSNEPDFNGHMYALAMGLAGLFSSIAIHQQYARCNLVGVKVKAAVMGLVYRKSLRLSRVKGGAGQVINLLTSEVNKINDAVLNFHFLWGAFVEVVLILCLSFYEIGISALPAVGFVLILLPLQMYLGKRTDTLGRGQALKTTERVHLMSEILTAIKLIKFYAWEAPFSKNIAQFRVEEMQFIYDGLINKVVNYTVVFSVPVLVSLSCLSLYVSLGNPLTASVSFTVLSVFNTLRYPFFMLPMAVKSTVGGYAAMDRLDAFFKQEEIVELKQSKPEEGNDLAFEMNNCDFKWDGTDGAEPTIRNVSVKIKKGSKVAIFGETGSGKSSILAALLGQIRQTKGNTVKVYGSTAYMSQEAWLLNMTLRDNILFGKPLEVQRYKKVIRVAGLQRDLTLLVAGDQTEIAERGVNLSGGQRQRVSLARAVYYDADIVLLDDPLSAVDSHVGRHIFDECFMKLLKEKTLVLVLNQLNYLSQMDHIIFVQDGKIVDQGTYKDLMETNEHFAKLINSHVDDEIKDAIQEDEENEEEPMNSPDFDPIEVISPESLVDPKIMAEFNNMSVFSHNQLSVRKNSKINENTIRSMIEKQNTTSIYGAERSHDVSGIMAQNEVSRFSVIGVVNQQSMDDFDGIISKNDPELIKLGKIVQEDDSTKTTGFADFVAYARSGSGVFDTIATIIFFALVHTIRIGGDFWLRLWVPRIGDYTDAVYIGVYGAFTALFAIGAFTRGYLFTRVTMAKARSLHEKLFDATIHAPMAFFDQTPIARLLSSFSKHQGHVDDTMLDAAIQAFQYLPLGLGAFLLSAILIEWNWIPCVIILGFGYLTLKYSNPADLKIKSLEAVTKPPIYSHLTATLEGLMSIRSYHAEHRFDELNLEKLDRNHEALFAMQNVKSFQALYIDILSSLIIYFSAFLLIYQKRNMKVDALAGLALSNALQMLVFVQWTIRQWGEVETQMSSVGQIVYYGNTKPEAPFEIPDRKPPASWPQQGLIKFKDVELKYQTFGVSVLKNVSLTIYPGEKIGIVGRTGSGKSTLLISLLRIVEVCNGSITLDGLDVSKIGLHDLRNKIAIIPQEPVMFVGTIRSNLDPFNKSTDDEIWLALDSVFLGEKFKKTPLRLETAVTENGKSVSQGQRQLLCIARAILSKAKVLVLDEATASLDAQTDMMIQEAIKKNFGELTMLTIAHRLNTIIDADRVLVMDAGKLVEFDEPCILLRNKDGLFRGLVDQTGASAPKLIESANLAHDARVARGYSFPHLTPNLTKKLDITNTDAWRDK